MTVASSPGMPATTMSPLSADGLHANDDEVTVEDAGIDHRLAAHAQHEQLAVAGEILGHGHELLDLLDREHAGARRDVADERDVTNRAPLGRRTGARLERDLDRPGLARVAVEIALVLEGGEMGVHGGRRREPDGLADLPDARRVAALADLGVDELQDLPLAGGERASGGDRGPDVRDWAGGWVGDAGAGLRAMESTRNTITRSGQTPVRIFT